MSTLDPVAARVSRQRRRRPVQRGILSSVLLLGVAVAGWGWGTLSIDGTEGAGRLLAVTIVASVVAWCSLLVFAIASAGPWRAAPFILGFAFLLLGGAFLVVRPAEPLLEFPSFLGLILLAFAVLVTLGGLRARSRVRSRARTQDAAVASGTRATAVVTDVPPGPDPSSRGLWAKVTFTFTDLSGTQRWVQRPLLIRRSGDVSLGDTTLLWYDSSNPGDDASIVVELARDNPLY